MYCRNFTVLSSFFDVKKQRPIMNLEKCYQCSGNIEISLDPKVYFSLVTCKINSLIALRSTNQITEISAPWWLLKYMWSNPQFSDNLGTFTEEILNGKLYFLSMCRSKDFCSVFSQEQPHSLTAHSCSCDKQPTANKNSTVGTT